MKLAEDEKIISSFDFLTLTNKRLIVSYRNAEESFPLSKITAVRFIYQRTSWMIILGLVFLLPVIFGGDLGFLARFISFIIAGFFLYFGIKGKSQLLIDQLGGAKYFNLSGKSQELMNFIDDINSRLS